MKYQIAEFLIQTTLCYDRARKKEIIIKLKKNNDQKIYLFTKIK